MTSIVRRLLCKPWLAVLVFLTAVVVAVAVGVWVSTPSPGDLAQRVGERVRRAGGAPIALARVSVLLREAVVATEDERFYRHHGIDLIGVLRAIPYDLGHLSVAQGASTITEQVAKLIYLGGNDHTLWRKLEDAALAVKLESRYNKEQILDAYLNSVYFGAGTTGAYAASERFFGVPPRGLDLAQASLLAGLIQAPTSYDPVQHPHAARLRQLDVLRSLVRNGFTTQEEATDAVAAPLPILGAAPLPGVHQGVDFQPGPAFVWRELAAGAAILLAALTGLFALRRTRMRPLRRLGAEAALGLILLIGAAAVVRSFRVL
jgi:membrane peptidoglycan carboxypeptidase